MAGRSRRLQPKELVPEYLTQGNDQEGLEERFINDFIGRGVFTTKLFSKGDFLLEYKGELITEDEGSRREDLYDPDLGSFFFFFKDGSKCFCVDATFSNGLGRLVNDASPNKANCNCVMRKIKEGKTYLALYALRDIAIGEELRYDYGVKDLPWRKLKDKQQMPVNSEAFACTVDEARGKDKEEVLVNSEDFPSTVDEASSKDKEEMSVNSEAFACTVDEASGKANRKADDKVEGNLQNCATTVFRDKEEEAVNSEDFACTVDEASGKDKQQMPVNSEAFACTVDEARGKDKEEVLVNSEDFPSTVDEASSKDKEEMSVNSEAFACTVDEASGKGLNIPLGVLYGHLAEEEPVEPSSDIEFVLDSSEENYKEPHSPVFSRKRPRDSRSDEEYKDPHVTMKKNSRKKTKAVILETDSEGEEDDSASVGANCDSSRREKIKSTELEVETKEDEAVARKRPHDGRSDECKGLHVTTKKNSWKRTKAVILKKESKREQDDGASVKLEVETKEDEEVVISCSKKGKYNARIYDKRHSCFYCDKLCAKIARHYEHHHEHEAEVAEAFAYPRGSKDRRKALEKLRLRGNFHHNLRVLECKSGELIVMRRPGEDEDCSQDDYLPCTHCLGFVKRNDLWRHNKACTFKSGDKDDKTDEDDGDYMKCQKLQAKSKLLVLPSICPGKSSPFQEVVASMRSDHITLVARNDSIISAFGAMMVEKLGTRRSHDISQNMRNVARLLISLREAEHNENAQLSQFLRPDKFDVVVQCVMDISKFDVKMGEKQVGTPSLALHVGHSLKKCVGIVRGKALREKDKGLLEDVEHFEKLMEAEWNYRISHHSLTTLNDRRHNQPDLLPITSDLQKLKEYITTKIISLTSQLQATSRPALRTWRELSELVLNRLILFNKRRGGETARLRVETYTSRPDWHKSTNQDVVASLSGIEQQLFKRLDMVEIKGKRGRKVPILLTKDVKKAIDVLVEKRSEVGVNPDNPYLFAATGNGSLGHLRPWECMKKVATNEDLQLEKPEAVTSTRLRKYVATVSQILDLQENELDWLARHLGHDIQVHREYYRLHESTIELAKVGKILTTVDEGKTTQWAGKSLDEIDLNTDIGPVADDEESGTEDDSGSDSDTELPSPSVNVRNQRQKGMERPSTSSKSNETSVSKASASASASNAKTKKTKQAKATENSAKTKKTKQAKATENSGPTATLRKKKSHIAWTKEEKDAVFKYLGEFVKRKIVPGKRECENCIKQSGGLLANRDWKVVKDCVRNVISRAKTLQEKNT